VPEHLHVVTSTRVLVSLLLAGCVMLPACSSDAKPEKSAEEACHDAYPESLADTGSNTRDAALAECLERPRGK
jgi:hypothetical protein